MIKPKERIKQLRRRLGWSRSDLARRLGYPTELIVMWEEGREQPTPHQSHTFKLFENLAEFNSLGIKLAGAAESMMKLHRLDQVHFSKILG